MGRHRKNKFNTHSISIRISDRAFRKLKAESHRTGKSMTSIVNALVEERYKEPIIAKPIIDG